VPAEQSGAATGPVDEVLRQRLELLSMEDPANYVPPLPAVSSDAHEKADMLIAYCTVKGMTTLRIVETTCWSVANMLCIFSIHQEIR